MTAGCGPAPGGRNNLPTTPSVCTTCRVTPGPSRRRSSTSSARAPFLPIASSRTCQGVQDPIVGWTGDGSRHALRRPEESHGGDIGICSGQRSLVGDRNPSVGIGEEGCAGLPLRCTEDLRRRDGHGLQGGEAVQRDLNVLIGERDGIVHRDRRRRRLRRCPGSTHGNHHCRGTQHALGGMRSQHSSQEGRPRPSGRLRASWSQARTRGPR